MTAKKDRYAGNDFWLIAPQNWGSEESMIRVQKDEASTPLKAVEAASGEGMYSSGGYTLHQEMNNHDSDGKVFVYECKEVGTYRQQKWVKVE